ncbi:CotH kinase family protein [bacterium]|nr:CotH kinase family protein [bacterium]
MRIKLIGSKRFILQWIVLAVGTFYISEKIRFHYDLARFATVSRDLREVNIHDKKARSLYLKKHSQAKIYNALTWKVTYPTKINLPTIELKIPENTLRAWKNVKEKPHPDWKNAWAKTWEKNYQNIKVRIRGDYSYHWGVDTPSIKIKMEKGKSFLGYRKFNLINPRSATGVERVIGATLAKKIDLLSEDITFVRVFVNGQNWGPFQFVGALEEEWLRKHRELPGDIYSGEIEPVGRMFHPNQVFKLGTDVWADKKFWKKVSHNNNILKDDFLRLGQAQSVLQESFVNPSKDNRKKFEAIFDVESLVKLMALENWLGSRHTDRLHNWKILHDPATGKLKIIAWDLWGHGQGAEAKDIDLFWPLALPQLNILRYSDLYLKKNQYLYQLLKIEEKDRVTSNTLSFFKKNILPLYAQAKNVHQPLWFKLNENTGIGTALEIYRDEVYDDYQRVMQYALERSRVIKHALEEVKVEASIVSDHRQQDTLNLNIAGEAAIEWVSIDNQVVKNRVKGDDIQRVFYPRIELNEFENWHSSYRAIRVSQNHSYILKKGKGIQKLVFKNLVTGQFFDVQVEQNKNNGFNSKQSIQYNVISIKDPKPDVYIGPGRVTIKKDTVFLPGQKVIIVPGTTLSLGSKVNFIVQGDFIAKGTFDQPIVIKPIDQREAFGAVVVQSANKAVFDYFSINGGSGGQYNGALYTGMLSLYNVKDVKLKNFRAENNTVYDDMVNFKKVQSFKIDQSIFDSSFADGLDLDYATGVIEKSTFSNTGNDGVDMMGSEVKVRSCVFNANQDKAISIGEASVAILEENKFKNTALALAVKDLSIVQDSKSTFLNVETWAKAYQKSQYYYQGGILITDIKNSMLISSDQKSNIINQLDALKASRNVEVRVPMERQIDTFKLIQTRFLNQQ